MIQEREENGWSDGIRCTQVEELAQVRSTYRSSLLIGGKAEYMSMDAGRWEPCGLSLLIFIFSVN